MRNHSIIAALLLASTLAISACDKSPTPQPPLSGPTPVAPGATPAPGAPQDLPPGHPPIASPAASTPGTSAASAPASDLGQVVAALGAAVTLPEGWKRNPPANQMRIAEAVAPAASNDPAQSCLVVFSTAGGSIEENITRWSGQVRDAQGMPVPPTSETKTIDGMSVTVVAMTGTVAGMGIDGTNANWTLRGAIIQAPQGNLFIKMTGPADTMSAQAASFAAMVDSLKKS